MATIKEMRIALHDHWPKATLDWHEKINNMPTKQVVAIYKYIQSKKEDVQEEHHQINIFEYMATCTEEGSHTQINI